MKSATTFPAARYISRACVFALLALWPALAAAQTPFAMTVVTQPEATVAGQSIGPVPQVRVTDSLGAPVTGTVIDVFPNKNSFAAGTTSFATTDSDGVAAFPGLVINQAASGYQLVFLARTAPGVRASSSTFTIRPAAASKAVVTNQPAQSTYGAPVAGSPSVTLYDAFDNPTQTPVNITASLVGGAFTAGSTVTVATGVDGKATFPNLIPDAAGSYTIKFTPASAVPAVTSSSFDVSKLELTIGGSFAANNKVYDGTTVATIGTNNLDLDGVVGTDNVNIARIDATFAQANAGTGIVVSLSNPVLGGSDAGNYTVTAAGAPTDQADITKAPLTIVVMAGQTFAVDDKVYNGTTGATIVDPASSLGLDGVVGSEDVTLDAVANFAQAGVGTDIAVNLSASTIGGTANLANYSFSTAGAPETTADITKAPLTIGGSFTANNKVYDGTTTATIKTDSLVLAGVVGTEDVTLNPVANFATANAGDGIEVSLAGSTLGGTADLGNYELITAGAPVTTADITEKELTISGSFSVNNKTYDGTTAATFKTDTLELVGVVGTEDVTLNPVADFAQADPGTNIGVNLANSSLEGAADVVRNYVLLTATPTSTANITAKSLTISVAPSKTFDVADKPYDGTTSATIVDPSALVLNGVVDGDEVIPQWVATFSQANVGTNLLVTLVNSTLGGADAAGYSLSFIGAPTARADISPKELTISGGFTANNKVYDGNTDATFKSDNLQLVGVVGTDNVTLSGKAIDFQTASAGTGKTVELTAATLAGTAKDNYELPDPLGAPTATADIEQKELTIGGSFQADDKPYDGNTDATFKTGEDKLAPEGVVGDDDVTLVDREIEFETPDAGTDKTVKVKSVALGGTAKDNYKLPDPLGGPTAKAAITPLKLTIGGTFEAEDKAYDGNKDATIVEPNTLVLDGTIIAGDEGEVTLQAKAEFDTANVGIDKPVNLAASTLAGAKAGNYELDTAGAPEAKADITKVPLTIKIGASSVEAGQTVEDLDPTPSINMVGLVGEDSEADITDEPVVYTSEVLPDETAAGKYPGDLGVEPNGPKAGNYSITQEKGELTITAAAPDKISITAQPSETTAGQILEGASVADPAVAQSPTVKVTDQFGNAVSGYVVSVGLNQNEFASGSQEQTTGSDGTATFGNLVIEKSYAFYELEFSGAGDLSATSAQFAIIAAAPRKIAILEQPGDAEAGADLSPSPSVQLQDQYGNAILMGGNQIDVELVPAAALFGTTSRETSVPDGQAVFAGLSVRQAGTYKLKFSSTAALVSSAESEDFVVKPEASSASISMVQQPTNTVAGVAIAPAPAVFVQDRFNNPISGYDITAKLEGGDFAAAVPPVATGANGQASFASLVINTAKAGYTITFSFAEPGSTPSISSDQFDVTHAGLATFVFGTVDNQTAGVSFNLAITAEDEFGNTVTSFTESVDLSLDKNTFAAGGGATPAFVNGVLASHAVTINSAAADYVITATADAIDGDSNAFDVSPAAAASITLAAPSPASVVAGQTSGNFTLTVKDAFDNTAPVNGETTFTLTTSEESATATFSPASLVLANGATGGTFTYANTKVGTGAHELTATGSSGDAGLAGKTAKAGITVTAAAANKLAIVTQPSGNAQAGKVFGQQPVVRVLDQYGNNVLQSGIAVSAAISPGQSGTLLGTTPVDTDADGKAAFTNLGIGGVAGPRTIVFSADSLTGMTSASIEVSPGDAAKLTMVTEPTETRVNNFIAPAPSVELTDAYGNVLADQTVQVALVPGTEGSFTADSTTSVATDAGGLAVFSKLKIDKSFTYQLQFSVGTVTVLSGQFFVNGGTPTEVQMVQQPPNGTAGVALSPAPSVKVVDEFGNAVRNIRVAVSLNGGSFAAGTLEGRTGTDGMVRFNDLVIDKAKTGYSLTFRTFVAGEPNVTSAPFDIEADYSTAVMTVATQPGATVAGQAVAGPPAVSVKDGKGNNVADKDVTVTLNTGSFAGGSTKVKTNASGVATFGDLIVNKAGSYTLTFRLDGYTAQVESAAFTVAPAAAANLVIVTEPSATASAGVAFVRQPAVQVQDIFGNNVSSSGRLVTASVATGEGALEGALTATTDANGQATFTDLRIDGVTGLRTLGFATGGLTSAVSQPVDVGAGAASSLSITDQPIAATAGQAILSFGDASLAVRATDAFGNNVQGVSITPEPNGFFFAGPGTPAVTDSGGVATFATLSTTEAGLDYTITFKAGDLSVESAEFNVDAATPAAISVLQQPLSGVVGTPLSPAPKVQLIDAYGNPNTSAPGYLIGVVINPGSFTGESVVSVRTTDDGTATFEDLVPAGAATGAVLSFNIGSALPSGSSAPFDILGSADPSTVVTVLLEGSQADLLAGATRTLTAKLLNAQGQPVSSGAAATGSVTFAAKDGTGGTLEGLGTVSAVGGIAVLEVTGGLPGEVSVSAGYESLESAPLDFTVIGLEVRIIRFSAAEAAPAVASEPELGVKTASSAVETYPAYELTFEVTAGAAYEVQFRQTMDAEWQTVLSGQADAAELTVELPVSPAQREGFWRVRAALPNAGPSGN